MKHVIIYVEAASSGERSAWGSILTYRGKARRLSEARDATSGPEMVLRGAIGAFEALTEPCRIEVVTSSQYLVRGITEWASSWEANAWGGASGQVVHSDQWRRLVEVVAQHRVTWHWMQQGSAGTWQREAKNLARTTCTKPSQEMPAISAEVARMNPFLPLVQGYQTHQA